MGSNIPTQIIPNRHFVKLEVQQQKPPSKVGLIGSVSVSSSTFLEAWASRLERLDKIKLIHMLLPLSWKVASSNVCGASKIVEIQYQNFNRTLSQEVKARAEDKKYFQQSKIWYASLALFTCAVQCIEEGDRITDFSLSNIFTNDEGNMKILTPYSLPETFDPYSDPGVEDVYLSPQELKGKQLRYMHNTTQPAKSMAFAIGMALLSICLLKPIYFLYDYDKNIINEQKLQSSLEQLANLQFTQGQNATNTYSDDLKNLISKLLQTEPSNRPSVVEVHKQIADMQGQIIVPKPVKIESPLISSTSPKKKSLGRGQAITLRPSKLKNNSSLSPIAVTEPRVEKIQKIQEQPFQPPLTQSKYVFSSPNPAFSSGLDLLRKIDERLQKSREQFPS